MKAAIAHGKGRLEIAEAPIPEPKDYQCLCKILACATCTGTDQKIVDGTLPWKEDYPGVLGHESVGRVVKIGTKVRYIKEGDIFLRPTAVYHGEKLGEYRSLWGGFAEYGLVTDTRAMSEDQPNATPNHYCIYQQKIPSEIAISPADATMLITLKEDASFLTNVGVRFHSSLVILGTGAVARSMCFFAKLYGAYPVIVIGRREEPLDLIRKFGADFTLNNQKVDMVDTVKEMTTNKGVDFVLDAAGDSDLLAKASQFLAPNGKVAPYALGHSFQYLMDRTQGPARWEYVFTGPSEELAHQYLLDLKRLNLLPLDSFYSHRLPFSQFVEGFARLTKKTAAKIVFEMES